MRETIEPGIVEIGFRITIRDFQSLAKDMLDSPFYVFGKNVDDLKNIYDVEVFPGDEENEALFVVYWKYAGPDQPNEIKNDKKSGRYPWGEYNYVDYGKINDTRKAEQALSHQILAEVAGYSKDTKLTTEELVREIIFKEDLKTAINSVYGLNEKEVAHMVRSIPVFSKPKKILVSAKKDAVIVFWKDGDKTVVKLAKDDEFDIYHAFTAALAKHIYGTNSRLHKTIEDNVVYEEPKKKEK